MFSWTDSIVTVLFARQFPRINFIFYRRNSFAILEYWFLEVCMGQMELFNIFTDVKSNC